MYQLYQKSYILFTCSTQGACMSSVKPEYLMDPPDYKKWVQLQKEMEAAQHKTGHWNSNLKTLEEEELEDQLFDAVSKRAWIDLLLQLLKVIVSVWVFVMAM